MDTFSKGINAEKGKASKQYKFSLNNVQYDWDRFITGAELRQLGNIPEDHSLYQKDKGNEVEVADEQSIDLSDNGIEHFSSRQNPAKNEVMITVNNLPRKIHRGSQPVSEIKKVGSVDPSHELEQLIDGRLTPLSDSSHVVIKGGEIFFSHVRDGSSA